MGDQSDSATVETAERAKDISVADIAAVAAAAEAHIVFGGDSTDCRRPAAFVAGLLRRNTGLAASGGWCLLVGWKSWEPPIPRALEVASWALRCLKICVGCKSTGLSTRE